MQAVTNHLAAAFPQASASRPALDELPESVKYLFMAKAPLDVVARLGCVNRAWRQLTGSHALLAPTQPPELPQQRLRSLIYKNEPEALARFLVGYAKPERIAMLNQVDASGLTPLMYMATLHRPAGGGIKLGCVMVTMGALAWVPSPYQAAIYAAQVGNVQLNLWLRRAEGYQNDADTTRIKIEDAISQAAAHMVRLALRHMAEEASPWLLLGACGHGHSANRVIETWTAFLETCPIYKVDACFSSLVCECLNEPDPVALLEFLHRKGILKRNYPQPGLLLADMLCKGASLSVVRYVVGALGENVHGSDGTHRTMLHLAVENSSPDVVDFLLEQGADLNALDAEGLSVLAYAARSGKTDEYRRLQSGGARYRAPANGSQRHPLLLVVSEIAKRFHTLFAGEDPQHSANLRTFAVYLVEQTPCSKRVLKRALYEIGKRHHMGEDTCARLKSAIGTKLREISKQI